MEEWQINKSSEECFGTGNKINPGDEFFAALVESEEGLIRRDFSVDYWESEQPEVYCFWKSKLPEPDQKKQMFIDDEMLMAFFARLAEEKDQEKLNFRFVLTLILMRKRKLKYDSSKNEDGKEVWKLKIMGSDDYAEVINPHLDESQIEELSSQVGTILQVDLQQ
jgi:hypothetical protein